MFIKVNPVPTMVEAILVDVAVLQMAALRPAFRPLNLPRLPMDLASCRQGGGDRGHMGRCGCSKPVGDAESDALRCRTSSRLRLEPIEALVHG